MPDFRDVEVFFWVARLGGFNRAAERLNTTQPAISQRIAGLERALGARLIDRRPRGLALTPKGREMLDYCERLIRLRADMIAAVAEPAAVSGLVRLGVSETIVHTWLARFIERAHAAYPRITLDIEVDVSPSLRDRLLGSAIDLAFMLGPVDDPGVLSLDLCRYPLSFVASAGLDLGPEPVPLARLARFSMITYSKTTQPYLALRRLLGSPDLDPPRIHSSSSLATIVRMALDGVGVGVIPAAVIGRELGRGDLRVVEAEPALPDLAFTAATLAAPLHPTAERLAQLAREVAREA